MTRSASTRPSTFALAFALLLVAGCGGGSTGVHPIIGGDGGSLPSDMAVASAPDLATPPDLATSPDLTAQASGACKNQPDQAVLMAKAATLQATIGKCAQDNFAQEPATKTCIKTMTGLSDGCSTCFDSEVQCVFMKCLNMCLQDQNGAPCTMCRMTNCDPAFAVCAGL